MNKQEKGFTLIELVVVMVIVGLLAAVAVPKFQDLTDKAEAASVKNILGSTRSALSIKIASGLVNGDDISSWVYNGSDPLNPMSDLLAEKPESYLGVLAANPASSNTGKWWDRSVNANDHWLMYKLKEPTIITQPNGAAGGGWSNNGTNIIHRIEAITEDGDTVGLFMTTTNSYDYNWAE